MISSGRVILRALERADLPLLQNWRNIDHFRANFREHRELNLVHQERWFERVHSDSSTHYMFAVCDSVGGEFIGAAGLCYINWVNRNADLSFYIGRDGLYADDAYGHDTVIALLKYGFLQLNLKRIWCELYETDSMKTVLLSTIGFKREGVLRSNAYKNGRFIDGHIFAILDDEYRILLNSSIK